MGGIIDLLFPKYCLSCQKGGKYICNTCLFKVEQSAKYCAHCGKASIDGFTHAKCIKKYGLNGLLSAWKYDGVVRKAIVALKFKYATEVAEELGVCLIEKIKDNFFLLPKESFLTPIPLHWYREKSRGFNQADLIGAKIAKFYGWRYISDILLRNVHKNAQVGLKAEERRQNVKGVFSFNPKYREMIKSEPSFIIFDDVYTTGSTLKEATKVLKRKTKGKVWGLTIAR